MNRNILGFGVATAWGLTITQLVQRPSGSVIQASADSTTQTPQRIVVHLRQSDGSPALHSALMGLGLATAMRNQGATVTVMLDSEAASLAKKSWADKAPTNADRDSVHPPMTLGKAIQRFVDVGGTIVMCPHCAASCGCEAADLADGARFGKEGELARVVLQADKILDY
ncbi:MAG: DsrE family protein [Planctomycetaceae bacterium]|nr:DsrE family protein [Planctomycetaceae bacterium]